MTSLTTHTWYQGLQTTRGSTYWHLGTSTSNIKGRNALFPYSLWWLQSQNLSYPDEGKIWGPARFQKLCQPCWESDRSQGQICVIRQRGRIHFFCLWEIYQGERHWTCLGTTWCPCSEWQSGKGCKCRALTTTRSHHMVRFIPMHWSMLVGEIWCRNASFRLHQNVASGSVWSLS